MRVKLSYTVEAEDVLKESAKILSLSGEDIQQCISLFKEIQETLVGNDDDPVPNIPRSLEMIEEFRKALLTLDTRLLEVSDIVTGYDDYQRDLRRGDQPGGASELPPEAE